MRKAQRVNVGKYNYISKRNRNRKIRKNYKSEISELIPPQKN